MNLIEKYLQYLNVEKKASPLTIEKARFEATKWVEWAGDPTTATKQQARDYLAHLKTKGLLDSTIKTKWMYVRSFCAFLRDEGHNPEAAKVSVKTSGTRLPVVIPADVLQNVLKTPNTRTRMGRRDRAILELLAATGIRASELVGIRLSDVDLGNEELRVIGKGDKQRIVPLMGNAARWLATWIDGDRKYYAKFGPPTNAVFLTRNGGPIKYGVVKHVVHKCAEKCIGQIGGLKAHAFRHTIATALLTHGMDLRKLQELLGHRSIATTTIYTHVAPTEMKSSYAQATSFMEQRRNSEHHLDIRNRRAAKSAGRRELDQAAQRGRGSQPRLHRGAHGVPAPQRNLRSG